MSSHLTRILAAAASALPMAASAAPMNALLLMEPTARKVADTPANVHVFFNLLYKDSRCASSNCDYYGSYSHTGVNWDVSFDLHAIYQSAFGFGDNLTVSNIVFTHKIAPHAEPPFDIIVPDYTLSARFWRGEITYIESGIGEGWYTAHGAEISRRSRLHSPATHAKDEAVSVTYYHTNIAPVPYVGTPGTAGIFKSLTLNFIAAHPGPVPIGLPIPPSLALLAVASLSFTLAHRRRRGALGSG